MEKAHIVNGDRGRTQTIRRWCIKSKGQQITGTIKFPQHTNSIEGKIDWWTKSVNYTIGKWSLIN